MVTKPEIKITVECLPEDMPYVGNCSAVDKATDQETEEYIRRELANGNEWAWCTIKVTVECTPHGYTRGVSWSEYLGGCSYRSEADFRGDVYFTDMVEECKRMIREAGKAV